MRATLVEAGAAAQLALGRAGDALAAASDLVERHPLRERPVELTMDALVDLGRRADALRAYDAFRRRLGEELGIEPSALLVARHAELLTGGSGTGTAGRRRVPTAPAAGRR